MALVGGVAKPLTPLKAEEVKLEVWVLRWQRKVNIRIAFNRVQTMTIGECRE